MFVARPFNRSVARVVCAEAMWKALGRAVRWYADCQARAEQRRALAALDGRMLKDIGLTTGDAARESAKPFWQA